MVFNLLLLTCGKRGDLGDLGSWALPGLAFFQGLQ